MGAILLNAQALALTAASGGIALSYSGSFGTQISASQEYNNRQIFTAISGGDSFELNFPRKRYFRFCICKTTKR